MNQPEKRGMDALIKELRMESMFMADKIQDGATLRDGYRLKTCLHGGR